MKRAFVTFYFPGSLFDEETTRPVETRELSALDVPSDAASFQFFDRAAIGLFQDAIHDRLLHLGTEVRDLAEIFPPSRYRAGEVLHEVPNAGLTACEVKQQVWSHHSPAQPRSPAHRGI